MPPAGADDHGVGSRARRRLDGGGWAEGGGSRGRFVEGSRGLGVGGSGGMRHVGGGGNEIGPERGRRVSSPRRDWNREGGRDSREMPRPVVIEPSHVPAIGGRGWERSPLRNGYRGGGADIEVGSGGGGADRGAPRYSNGVESGGGWGSGGGAGYRDDSRNRGPSSRYAADVQQGRPLAHVVARESWDQPLARPPSRERGVGQWPGNISHGPPPGGWNHNDPPNRISQREDSRNAAQRFSGSNRSGSAINTFSGVKNSSWNGGGGPPGPANKHQYQLNGPSRDRPRRSDRSRSRSRGKPGGGGGYRDYSIEKNRYGAGRASRADLRLPLRRSPPVRRPRSRGRSPGRARRVYAGGSGGGGGAPRRDDFTPQKFTGESRNGGGRESRYVNGGGRGDGAGGGGYAKFAAGSHRNDGRRNEGRSGDWVSGRGGGGGGSGKGSGRHHGRSPSWRRGDSAASGRRNGGGDHSGSGDDQGHYKARAQLLRFFDRSLGEGRKISL